MQPRSERTRGRGPTSTWRGRGGRGAGGAGREPKLTRLRGSSRRGRGQADAEAEREGAREGPPPAHGRAREPPPPPLSETRSLPPRLWATDGAAGGMTGNSWARAAESKYEHRSRAREDGGARPPRMGRAARPRRPPAPPGPPPRLRGRPQSRRPPAATRRWKPSARVMPFQEQRAEHPPHESHLRPLRRRKKEKPPLGARTASQGPAGGR